jgi:hypothetical protein
VTRLEAIDEIQELHKQRIDTLRAWKLAEFNRRAALRAIDEACERYGISPLKFSRLARGVNGAEWNPKAKRT